MFRGLFVGAFILCATAQRGAESFATDHAHHAPPPPRGKEVTPTPLGIAEIQEPAVVGMIAFYHDWTIVRVRILDPRTIRALNNGCFDGDGIGYTIDGGWGLTTNSQFGPGACDAGITSGVYDPTLACPATTGNALCATGIPPSSGNPWAGGVYTCNPAAYRRNPYTCAVGDLSGKYGMLNFNLNGTMILEGVQGEGLPPPPSEPEDREVEERATVRLSNGNDVIFDVERDRFAPLVSLLRGRSVSLRCNDGTRFACARIQYASSVPVDLAKAEILARLARQRGALLEGMGGSPFRRAEELSAANDEDASLSTLDGQEAPRREEKPEDEQRRRKSLTSIAESFVSYVGDVMSHTSLGDFLGLS